jgi:hypothetical protein
MRFCIASWNVNGRIPTDYDQIQLLEKCWIDWTASVIVVGVQELRISDRLAFENVIHKSHTSDYCLVGKEFMLNLGIFVFVDTTCMENFKQVEFEWIGTGFLQVFGNKGCVGARLLLEFDRGLQQIIFVNCHLTAHKEFAYLRQRFESVQEMHRELEILSGAENALVFLFGDLNYRVVVSENMRKSDIYENIKDEKWEIVLKNCDQLYVEHEYSPLHRSFKGLLYKEIRIPDFPPTYKYRVNSNGFSEKHIPSWTDRVLTNYLEIIDQHSYQSIMETRSSDHKPISLCFTLKKQSPGKFSSLKNSNREFKYYLIRDCRRFIFKNYILLIIMIWILLWWNVISFRKFA